MALGCTLPDLMCGVNGLHTPTTEGRHSPRATWRLNMTLGERFRHRNGNPARGGGGVAATTSAGKGSNSNQFVDGTYGHGRLCTLLHFRHPLSSKVSHNLYVRAAKNAINISVPIYIGSWGWF